MSSVIADLPALPSQEVHEQLEDLENGGLFARLGVRNFLEGDLFGWYLAEWNSEIEGCARELARVLGDFEPATGTLEPDSTRDLLKKLYEYLIPRQLRHDLGEYYTPDWLAELTLDEAGYGGDISQRLLDPACGSGTFLVLAIRRAREFGEEHLLEPREIVQRVLSNIVGFDINPLAVIASRTNYLLALGPLMRHSNQLDIPVYLCDSVLSPLQQKGEQEGEQKSFLHDYTIPSTVGDFHIPRVVVSQGQLPSLTALLEECVRHGYTPEEFLARAHRRLGDLDEFAQSSLDTLFRKVAGLEREGRNGIWARIVKNAFAPVFCGHFDYVIGNPPWVRWSFLADSYRQATLPLWVEYGLFSLRASAARLGGGEKDFSMLFLYACADTYLKPGGTLGFVITQEVLKGKGAGEGFRRFQLGANGAKLGVTKAHDLVAVAPFEGAANKTAMIVLRKGSPTTYPVPYSLWRRRHGVGVLDPGLHLERAMPLLERQEFLARPIAESLQSAWQTTALDQQGALDGLRGVSAYKARRGASTEPYGVFWLDLIDVRSDGALIIENLPELGKREIRKVQAVMESQLVFPAIRGKDVHRWRATPLIYTLISQDPRTREGYPESQMKVELPETYKYLLGFKDVLLSRGSRTVRELAERTVFWSMFGIGEYSFAPFRVTWKRMADDLVAAVVSVHDTPFGERQPIGTDTTAFLPVEDRDEAHFLCALLNSSPARAFIRSFSSGGRGFGAPSIVTNIALPTFEARDQVHVRLAVLSQLAHQLASKDNGAARDLPDVEEEIDQLAATLWGVADEHLMLMRKALIGRRRLAELTASMATSDVSPADNAPDTLSDPLYEMSHDSIFDASQGA